MLKSLFLQLILLMKFHNVSQDKTFGDKVKMGLIHQLEQNHGAIIYLIVLVGQILLTLRVAILLHKMGQPIIL
jgi:hypothetical protein